MRLLTLPTDSNERKEVPLLRGFFRYFPAAIAGAARLSKIGNDKHNPGEEMHHARGKSNDHGDCVLRHLMDIQELERLTAGPNTHAEMVARLLSEADSLVWRAAALSQELYERFGAPLAPGAKLPPPPLAEQIETARMRFAPALDIDATITKLRRQMAKNRRSRGNKKPRRR